jgi:hypothetical protein
MCRVRRQNWLIVDWHSGQMIGFVDMSDVGALFFCSVEFFCGALRLVDV